MKSSTPSATVSASPTKLSLPAPKPASPPIAPGAPPQLVACGDRDFYRITQSSLQVFEVAPELPPPEIRGSRIARQTTEIPIAGPANVFSIEKKRALVAAKDAIFQYVLGQTETRRHAPIAVSGAFVAWPHPKRADSFLVHGVGDKSLQEYRLGLPASGAGGAPAATTSRAEILPDFDSRLFTVLSDGTPFYSTPKGLVRRGHESRPAPLPVLSEPVTKLWADAAPDRYWAAGERGKLGLWSAKHGAAPLFTSSVPGVVIDSAVEGKRVAVLSMALVGQDYQPTVTIFSNGEQRAKLPLGPSAASEGQPELDLCLIRGRPWVVVGNRQWLQLLDWDTRRLLAEW